MADLLERAAQAVASEMMSDDGVRHFDRDVARAALKAALALTPDEVDGIADDIESSFDIGADKVTYARAAIASLEALLAKEGDE